MTLLKMMGQSGQVPGAIRAEEVAAARQLLEENVNKHEPPESSPERDEEAPVTLVTRAVPLLALLESAIEAGADIIWEQ